MRNRDAAVVNRNITRMVAPIPEWGRGCPSTRPYFAGIPNRTVSSTSSAVSLITSGAAVVFGRWRQANGLRPGTEIARTSLSETVPTPEGIPLGLRSARRGGQRVSPRPRVSTAATALSLRISQKMAAD
jgi:hypothetical protein